MQPWKAWGNLDNITLEPLRTFLQCNLGNLEGTFYNVTLGTLKEPLQYNLGNLGKLGNLQGTLKKPWGYLLGTLREPWQSNLGNLLETFTMSPWEPLHNNLGNLDNLYLENLGSLQGTLKEPWGNLLGTFWEPWGNLEETWEPLLGNLGTFTWEPLLGNLGTFTWEPLLGTWTLGEWVLELLRSAPKPLLWLKTPKHSAVGEKVRQTSERWADASCAETISKPKLGGKRIKETKTCVLPAGGEVGTPWKRCANVVKPRGLYKAQKRNDFWVFQLQVLMLIWHLFCNIPSGKLT